MPNPLPRTGLLKRVTNTLTAIQIATVRFTILTKWMRNTAHGEIATIIRLLELFPLRLMFWQLYATIATVSMPLIAIRTTKPTSVCATIRSLSALMQVLISIRNAPRWNICVPISWIQSWCAMSSKCHRKFVCASASPKQTSWIFAIAVRHRSRP